MQDYKLVNFKTSDFQDQHGNVWASAAFEGVSEPVKWVVKNPDSVKVGETYYGEIKEHESKAGKPYLRFHRAKKEDRPQRDDSHIRAQWAIGQAVQLSVNGYDVGKDTIEGVERIAKDLFAMVERVKGSTETPKEEPKPEKKSGYETFKANRPTKHEERDEDREFVSLMQKGLEAGDDIDLNDIPF